MGQGFNLQSPGDPSMHSSFVDVIFSSTKVKQVSNIQIDTATNGAEYPISVSGYTHTHISETTNTTTLATNIKNDLKQNAPEIFSLFDVTSSTNNVILTAKKGGVAYDVSSSSANVTVSETTAASESNKCYAGMLCYISGAPSYIGRAAKHYIVPFNSSSLVAGIYDWTLSYVSGRIDTISLDVDGVPYAFSIVHATDTNGTVDAFVTAINAAMPANTVLAERSSSKLRLTAEVKGLEISNIRVTTGSVAAAHSGNFDSLFTKSTSTNKRGAKLQICIPVREGTTESDSTGAYYDNGKQFRAWIPTPMSSITVKTSKLVTANSQAFYITEGANAGKWTDTKVAYSTLVPGFIFSSVNGLVADLMFIGG